MQEYILEIKCNEIDNCKGILKRFMYGVFKDSEISQFKCSECNNYIRIVNGQIYSMGKYNTLYQI